MANPNPSPETRFQPGNTSGKGAPRGPRITTRLLKLLEERKSDEDVAEVWLAAALGDEEMLRGRKPNFAFFKELLDRVEGKPADKLEAEVNGGRVVVLPPKRGDGGPAGAPD